VRLIKKFNFKDYDFNKDGEVTDAEKDRATQLLELELREEKADAQKRISWIAMASMLIVTAILVSPVISPEKVAALGDLISMFYLAMASIIGFYFGATAYMSKSPPVQY
jgi:dolichol kinase